MSKKIQLGLILTVVALCSLSFLQPNAPKVIPIALNTHIALVGGNMGSRMINYDHFETELHLRYPDIIYAYEIYVMGEILPGFVLIQLEISLGLFLEQVNFKMNLPIHREVKDT